MLFLVLPAASFEASAAVWYVNDTSTTGDSYTYAAGSDTQGGTTTLPFRTLKQAIDSASAGDTLYVDAGIYDSYVYITSTETAAVHITKDSIAIIGKDSASTIIDPAGENTITTMYGIYADTQVNLTIKNLAVTGAQHGVYFVNVDASTLTGDSVSSNGAAGIKLDAGSDSNTISNSLLYANGFAGANVVSSAGNTLTNNLIQGNTAMGVMMDLCPSGTVSNNTVTSNPQGLEASACTGIIFTGNMVTANLGDGLTVFSSANCLVTNNVFRNNSPGISLFGAAGNVFVQNTLDSNANYQISISGTSSSDTFIKNNITPSSSNPDSAITNSSSVTTNKFTMTRNWWGTTDEVTIRKRLFHDGGGDSVTFSPYRLAVVDTSAVADTTAPLPPIGVTCTAATGYITVTWAIPTVDEETNGGSFAYAGAKIYRLTNTADTNNWANSANLVWTASSTATSWNDTTVSSGSTYYYRLSSFDAATFVNHSALSDTKSASASGATAWYVNDTYSSSTDSFTYSAGSDTGGSGTAASPYRSAARALQSARSGDTIYVDAGVYADTYVHVSSTETAAFKIDTDNLTIIGAGSEKSVIDPPGANDITTMYGIYADTQSGLKIQNLGVRGAYVGIKFVNVDTSTLIGDSVSSNGQQGVYLLNSCDSITILDDTVSFNASSGLLIESSRKNHVGGSVVSANSFHGIYLNASTGNTLRGNTANSNAVMGMMVELGSTDNLVESNTLNSNAVLGLELSQGADNNQVVGNTMKANLTSGITVNASSWNTFVGNVVASNLTAGIELSSCTANVFAQNTLDSNGNYQISIFGTSSSDTFFKNNIAPSSSFPDSAVTNSSTITTNNFTMTRNWWGTTDEVTIRKRLFHDGGGDSVVFSPYRFGPADTAAGADTTAPLPPIGVTCTAATGYITVTWAIPTVDEETNGGSFGYSGAKVYRLTNTADTNNWANSANLVWTASSSATSWNDTTVTSGSTYYYRLSSFDTATYVNHSALTDTKSATATGGSSKWYVNDTATSADSFTYAGGADTAWADGSASKPYRSVRKALQSAKAGDTIYVDAGLFGDTGYDTFAGYTETAVIKIDTDLITIIGKDSGSTILDPPGVSTLAGSYGVYADTQYGLVIKNVGITGAYEGVHFENVDSSVLSGDSVAFAANYGVYLLGNCETNTITNSVFNSTTSLSGMYLYNGSLRNFLSNNIVNGNGQVGIYLNTSAETNTITGNTVNANAIYGIYLINDCNFNTIFGNAVGANTQLGIYLNGRANNNLVSGNSVDTNNAANTTGIDDRGGIVIDQSRLNLVTGNAVRANGNHGIYVTDNSESNLVRNNLVKDNLQYGVGVSNSRWNVIEQNQLDSNAIYQVYLTNAANADTFSKNNFRMSPSNPDSAVFNNVSGQLFVFTRNWWDTTDEVTMRKRASSVEGGDSIVFSPYRLGLADTTADADTTAPLPPVGVALTPDTVGQIKVSWTIPTVNEETNGGTVDYGGAYIYRTNMPDTTDWANPANLVWIAGSSDSSWTDTTTLAGNVYYYRLTSIDTRTIVNQSFFSDTVYARATRSVWYVNDTYSSSTDSFTYAAGSDTGSAAGSPSKPYRSVAKVMQFAKSYDTIYVDAGLYADTYVNATGSTDTAAFRIDTNYITIIGKDSNSTVFDAPGDSKLTTLYGIYASGKAGLVIQGIGVRGAYYGLYFNDVDSSKIISDSVCDNYLTGIYMTNADSNVIQYSVAGSNNGETQPAHLLTSLSASGIYVSGNNNLVTNTVSESNVFGIRFRNTSNTLSNSSIRSNSQYGVYLDGASASRIENNVVANNLTGVQVGITSSNNLVVSNIVTNNDSGGVAISVYSNTNMISYNDVSSNDSYGVYISSSSYNVVSSNSIDSNLGYQIYVTHGVYFDGSPGTSPDSNIIFKNNINASNTFPESGVFNRTGFLNNQGNNFDYGRNWWGTTDELRIRTLITDTSTGIKLSPYRLGIVDTTSGADTTAPLPPVNVSVTADSTGQIALSWTIPTVNEETNGGAVGYSGAKIYRLTNTADTNNWGNTANLVWTAGSSATSWTDTTTLAGNTYYYRLTSIDGNGFVNQSFFTDTKWATATRTVWYVNDTYSSATDSFTYIAGSDTGSADGSPSKPYRSVAKVMQFAKSYDTIYVDAGLYADTYVVVSGTEKAAFKIDTDYLTLIGKDSSSAVIDPPGSLSGSGSTRLIGIYASNRKGVAIHNIGIVGADYGIYFDNVDSSSIVLDSVSNSVVGFFLANGSDSNVFQDNFTSFNNQGHEGGDEKAGYGYYLDASGKNMLLNNVSNSDSGGIAIRFSSGNYLYKNRISRNTTGSGIGLAGSASNVLSENTIESKSVGISMGVGYAGNYRACSSNIIVRNKLINNDTCGIYLVVIDVDSNAFVQNEISGAETGILISNYYSGTPPPSNIFIKNNIFASKVRDVYSTAPSAQYFSRNWWGTTDEVTIKSKFLDTISTFIPYRIGLVDTSIGADTTAPGLPASVTLDTASPGLIKLTWTIPTVDEETNGGSVGYAGAKIYRLKGIPDTTQWANSALLVWTAGSSDTTWTDTGAKEDTTYYYRLTSFDSATYVNQSFFTDTKWAKPTSAGVVRFFEDTGFTDEVDTYLTRDYILIEVRDTDENRNSSASETVTVKVYVGNGTTEGDSAGLVLDTETILLTEVGLASGIFQCSPVIVTDSKVPASGDGIISWGRGDTVYVIYTDSNDANDTAIDTALAIEIASTSRVQFYDDTAFTDDVDTYKTRDVLYVAVFDTDENRNPQRKDTVSVTVYVGLNTSGLITDTEVITLTESTETSGIFLLSAGINLTDTAATTSNNGFLTWATSDTLQVDYLDVTGGTTDSASDTALLVDTDVQSYSGPVWYVNDTSTTGDIYTSAIGYDTSAGVGSASAPFRSVSMALRSAKSGDTIYIDAGRYGDTGYDTFANYTETAAFRIDTDYLTIIGKDSNATVIDPPGSNTTVGLYAIYADSQIGLVIKNLGVTGAYDGIHFVNVDLSTITGDSASSNSSSSAGAGVYLLNGCDTNTVSNNTANSNFIGILVDTGSNNTISNNTTTSNSWAGILLAWGSNNTVGNNTANSTTQGHGIDLEYTSSNRVSNNTAKWNSWDGIVLNGSSNNVVVQNMLDSNAKYQIYIDGPSSSDTVAKNNIRTSPTNPDSGVFNGTNNALDFPRKWWDTTDEVRSGKMIYDTATAVKITWRPYRLGPVDTASGADTTAPGLVAGVSLDTSVGNIVKLTWTIPTVNEETNGGTFAYNGARIYRLRNTVDTNHWGNPANLAWIAGESDTQWSDTGVVGGETYYYRITSLDSATYVNQSFFTDTQFAKADSAYAGPKWYVNDTYSSSADSFTYAGGNDTSLSVGDGSTSKPFRSVARALQKAKSGDTIYVDAGLYADTYVWVSSTETAAFKIDTDYITVVGKDSAASVIDPPGDSMNRRVYGVYATGRVGLTIKNLGVTGAGYGINWLNVDSSTLSGDGVSSCGFYGIALGSASDSNTISGNLTYWNDSYGIYLESNRNNSVTNNLSSWNGIQGIFMNLSYSNTVCSNTLKANFFSGIYLESCTGNSICGNTADSNNNYGIALTNASKSNQIYSNLVTSNGEYGIKIDSSADNLVRNNLVRSNFRVGVQILNSDTNTVTLNDIAGNDTGVRLQGVSRNNLITKNNFLSRISANVWNASAQTDTITFNWWGTTAEDSITALIADTASNAFRPYRIGVIDTTPGADSTAPAPPVGVALDTNTYAGRIVVTWTIPTVNEETNGGTVSWAGAYVYRTNKTDTTHWANTANRVWISSSTATSWTDTGVTAGETYYYRLTSIDGSAVPNQSFFTDTKWAIPQAETQGRKWYVNDTYSSSTDSFTYAAGSDTSYGDGTVNKPYRSVAKALQGAKSGDTIYVDAGLYADTYVLVSSSETAAFKIDTDYITIIGKDSNATVFDPPGAKTVEGLFGIYADTQTGLVIRDLGVTGALAGIAFLNVDSSTISGDSLCSNDVGVYFASGSDSNTVTGVTARYNGIGIYLDSSSSNAIRNNMADSNSNFGVYLKTSASNTISGNTADSNSVAGIYLNSSWNNTLETNAARFNASAGIYLASSRSNTLYGNAADSNATYGFYFTASDTNTLSGNAAHSNSGFGIRLVSSSYNVVTRNATDSNATAGLSVDTGTYNTVSGNRFSGRSASNQSGILLAGSDSNVIAQNDVSANAYGVLLNRTSSGNTITRNNFTGNTTYHALNQAGLSQAFTRNWWDTTDEVTISQKFADTASAFIPYRLGKVDTTAGADTTAPGLPASVSVSCTSAGCSVTWTIPTVNEETNGGTVGYAGAIIYRTNTTDTSNWANKVNLVWTASSSATSWIDTQVTAGNTYYYRLTSFDSPSATSPFFNQSFFTDTKSGTVSATDTTARAWYVNDTYSSSTDSFTYAAGADTSYGDGSTSKPYRSVAKALQSVKSGDTIFVDAGLYTDTYVMTYLGETAAFNIDTDYISIIGKDSNSTVIDPPGSASVLFNKVTHGIFADSQAGLLIKNLGVTGAYDGIHFENVDSSIITGDSVSGTVNSAVTLQYGCEGNTVSSNLIVSNSGAGIWLYTLSSGNLVDNNRVDSNLGGIALDSSSSNIVSNNTVKSNTTGIDLKKSSNQNILRTNVISSNLADGISLSSSSDNFLVQNTLDSNAQYQIYITGSSSSDTVLKNNIRTSTRNADSGVFNSSGNTFDFTRNWWDTTDEVRISKMIYDTGASTNIKFSPYRLGAVDTTAGADSTAPGLPANVTVSCTSAGCSMSWTIPTVNEETNGGSVGYAGAKIYRLKNTVDTTNWGNPANLVWTASSSATSWVDTQVTAGNTYYYRLTSFDAATFMNQSFFTDTKSSTVVSGGVTVDTVTVVSGNHQITTISSRLSSALRVRLTDSTGAAIPYARVTFAIASTPSTTGGYFRDSSALTSSDSAWTDSDGYVQDTFTLGTTRGVYLITATSDSNTSKKALFYAYADGVDITASKWRMVATNKTAATTFGTITAGMTSPVGYGWNEAAGVSAGVSEYSQLSSSSAIDTGRSYWVYTASSGGYAYVSGSTALDTVRVALTAGWHMISSGQYFYVDWDSGVWFDTNGEKYLPAKADSLGIIKNTLFWYTGSGYYWGPDPLTAQVSHVQMKPMTGFWLYTPVACTMWVGPYPASPAETSTYILQQAPNYKSEGIVHEGARRGTKEYEGSVMAAQYVNGGSDVDWVVRLTAAAGDQVDFQNYVGVKPTAQEAARSAVFDPPAAAGNFVAVGVRAGEGAGGGWLAASYAEPVTTVKTWEVSLATDMDSPVVLSWENVASIPPQYDAYLIGAPTGPANLRQVSSLVLQSAIHNPQSAITLAVGLPEYLAAFLAGNLDRTQTFAYPNPGPDGATGNVTFKYNLQAAQDITVRIFDVGGRLVRELRQSGVPGSNLLPWDTANRYGQKLGSGVYIYIIQSGGEKLVDKVAIVR